MSIERIPYFDAHCDTALYAYLEGISINRSHFHLDLSRIGAYAPAAQVFSFCAPHREGMTELTDCGMDEFLRQIRNHSDKVKLCLSGADIASSEAEGKIAAFISVEGAEKLDCSIEKLRRAYDKGLRIVHLCWNHENILTGSCWQGTGLTEAGKEFFCAAQDMGVAVDMSHISEAAFWSCVELAKRPILAGHSNSAAVCPHPRNLTDEQFKALVKLGGAAGLNFYRDIIGGREDIEAIIDHAEHFLALGGEKAVCLGADWDGIDMLPEGIEGVQSMPKVYEAMLRRNWSEDLVRDIFYGNLKRVLEAAI